jgi:hypothetical protein
VALIVIYLRKLTIKWIYCHKEVLNKWYINGIYIRERDFNNINHLEKDFIVQNYDKLYKLIKILNDKKYDDSYRSALCYLDGNLNKPLF